MKKGFDNDLYIRTQSEHIKQRIAHFGGKLYLEFGGKLYDDNHAERVLPGFLPDSKLHMLASMSDQAEIVIVINSYDIEKNKLRGDLGITYDLDALRLIDAFRAHGMYVGSVVLTRYAQQPAALVFENRLCSLGIPVYHHFTIPEYPANTELILSRDGFGRNDFVPTSRPLVVVTAPGPGSGKMAFCLSQIYQEHERGVTAGYAKFETFPVWNLPLNHPVNLAYESATTDLNDVNIIDPFHLEAYGKTSVNYNRDVEIFPVLSAMFKRIFGSSPYLSPTDMGVNMAGFCITDDEAVRFAAGQEIIRRFYTALCAQKQGMNNENEIAKLRVLMAQAGICPDDRPCVKPARDRAVLTSAPAAAIELTDGTIITGRTSELMGAASAMLLNALKHLGGIRHELRLLAPSVIEPIQRLKLDNLHHNNPHLHMDETLLALSICSTTNPTAELALAQLGKLYGADVHSTVILSSVDYSLMRRLGINVTSDPAYQTNRLFHS